MKKKDNTMQKIYIFIYIYIVFVHLEKEKKKIVGGKGYTWKA